MCQRRVTTCISEVFTPLIYPSMDHLPGYTGHVRGVRWDCGRRTSVLAAHNNLLAPSSPQASSCIRLDDLAALVAWEALARDHSRGPPLPVLRSRLDHTPTPTTLLVAATTPTLSP